MNRENSKNYPRTVESKNSYLRIRAPEHLEIALEGLIRKVLKEQPKMDDIYGFAADYFDMLLKIREKAGIKKLSVKDICPYHNEEDASEMIKLASNFTKRTKETKPITKTYRTLTLPKTDRSKNQWHSKNILPRNVDLINSKNDNLDRLNSVLPSLPETGESENFKNEVRNVQKQEIQKPIEEEVKYSRNKNVLDTTEIVVKAKEVINEENAEEEEEHDDENNPASEIDNSIDKLGDIDEVREKIKEVENEINKMAKKENEKDNKTSEVSNLDEPNISKEKPEESSENNQTTAEKEQTEQTHELNETNIRYENTIETIKNTEEVEVEEENPAAENIASAETTNLEVKTEQDNYDHQSQELKQTDVNENKTEDSEGSKNIGDDLMPEEKSFSNAELTESLESNKPEHKSLNSMEKESPELVTESINQSETQETNKAQQDFVEETEKDSKAENVVAILDDPKQNVNDESNNLPRTEEIDVINHEESSVNTVDFLAIEKKTEEAQNAMPENDEVHKESPSDYYQIDGESKDKDGEILEDGNTVPAEESTNIELAGAEENVQLIEHDFGNRNESTDIKISESGIGLVSAIMPTGTIDSDINKTEDRIGVQSEISSAPTEKELISDDTETGKTITGSPVFDVQLFLDREREFSSHEKSLTESSNNKYVVENSETEHDQTKLLPDSSSTNNNTETHVMIESPISGEEHQEVGANPKVSPNDTFTTGMSENNENVEEDDDDDDKEKEGSTTSDEIEFEVSPVKHMENGETDHEPIENDKKTEITNDIIAKEQTFNAEENNMTEPHIVLQKYESEDQSKQESAENTQTEINTALLQIPPSQMEEYPGQKENNVIQENENEEIKKQSPMKDVAEDEDGEQKADEVILECGNVGNEVIQRGEVERVELVEGDEDILQVHLKTTFETEQTMDDMDDSAAVDSAAPVEPKFQVSIETKLESPILNTKNSNGKMTLLRAAVIIQNEFRRFKKKRSPQQAQFGDNLLNNPVTINTNENVQDADIPVDEVENASSRNDDSHVNSSNETNRQDKSSDMNATRTILESQSLDHIRKISPLKTKSLSTVRDGIPDFEVWNKLVQELEQAATKIQSNFRGYKTRKILKRENAIQSITITSEDSTSATETCQSNLQQTGEFHDSVILD